MTIRNALKFSVITQIATRFINLLSVIILARLLAPEELGVFAIAGSIAFIASEFRFLGTGNYLIRSKEINEQKRRSVFGVSLLVSWVLGIVLVFSASSLENYFNYDDLTELFQIMSLTFFIAPLVVVPNAILTRNLNFKTLFVITIVPAFLTLLATITMVYMGLSYFSLAYATIISICLQILFTILLAPKEMTYIPSFKDNKDIFNFGFYNAMANLLNRLTLVCSDLIIGKIGNARDVAMFSRGLGFLDFLSNAITLGFRPVALPYLSNSFHNKENINSAYLRAINLLGSLCWPIISVAGIGAFPIVLLLFGPQWMEAAPIVSYLVIWMVFKMIHMFAMELFIAANMQKILFYRSLLVFLLTAFAIYASYDYGLVAVGQAMAIVGVVEFLFTSYQLSKYFQLGYGELIKSIFPNIVLTISVISATFLLSLVIDFYNDSPFFVVCMIALVNIPLWILMVKILKLEIYDELMKMVKR